MSNKKETIQQIIGLLSSLIEDDAPEAEPTPKAKTTKRKRSLTSAFPILRPSGQKKQVLVGSSVPI